MVNKYNIDDLYVGEIHIAHTYYDLSSQKYIDLSIEKFNNITKNLLKRGASKMDSVLPSFYYSKEKDRTYARVLSLLKKESEDTVISLNDDNKYKENGVNFYKNLSPFENYIPKIDTEILDVINRYDAIRLFILLFKRGEFSKNSMYYRNKKDLNDFYTATLRELVEAYNNYGTNLETEEFNIKERLLLEINKVQKTNTERINKVYENNKTKSYIYQDYECLLYKCEDEYYNLNNYQVYNLNDKENQTILKNITPFKETLETNGMITKEQLSIPKALSLHRRIR